MQLIIFFALINIFLSCDASDFFSTREEMINTENDQIFVMLKNKVLKNTLAKILEVFFNVLSQNKSSNKQYDIIATQLKNGDYEFNELLELKDNLLRKFYKNEYLAKHKYLKDNFIFKFDKISDYVIEKIDELKDVVSKVIKKENYTIMKSIYTSKHSLNLLSLLFYLFEDLKFHKNSIDTDSTKELLLVHLKNDISFWNKHRISRDVKHYMPNAFFLSDPLKYFQKPVIKTAEIVAEIKARLQPPPPPKPKEPKEPKKAPKEPKESKKVPKASKESMESNESNESLESGESIILKRNIPKEVKHQENFPSLKKGRNKKLWLCTNEINIQRITSAKNILIPIALNKMYNDYFMYYTKTSKDRQHSSDFVIAPSDMKCTTVENRFLNIQRPLFESIIKEINYVKTNYE